MNLVVKEKEILVSSGVFERCFFYGNFYCRNNDLIIVHFALEKLYCLGISRCCILAIEPLYCLIFLSFYFPIIFFPYLFFCGTTIKSYDEPFIEICADISSISVARGGDSLQ